jgi:hypothetical protein
MKLHVRGTVVQKIGETESLNPFLNADKSHGKSTLLKELKRDLCPGSLKWTAAAAYGGSAAAAAAIPALLPIDR